MLGHPAQAVLSTISNSLSRKIPAMVHYASSTKSSIAALSNGSSQPLRIRGVVFDMDGTLASPITEHLVRLSRELGVPKNMGILEYVDTYLKGEQRIQAENRIVEVESEAMATMELSPGLVELLQYLHDNEMPIGIITRNNAMAAQHFLQQVVRRQPKEQWELFNFNPVIDRTFKPVKPEPHSFLHISKLWGIPPQELMMVGDHLDDLLCGVRAGGVSALLRYEHNGIYEHKAHISVDRIDDLITKLDNGFDADMSISGNSELGGYA